MRSKSAFLIALCLGTIPSGTPPQSVGFAGPNKKTLYIVGRGALYKTQMIAEGIKSRAK